jgi:hypothetical protein
MDVKYRWKNIVCSIAGALVSCWVVWSEGKCLGIWWGWSSLKLLMNRKQGRGLTLDYVLDTGQVGKNVQVVLWPATRLHAHICVLTRGSVAAGGKYPAVRRTASLGGPYRSTTTTTAVVVIVDGECEFERKCKCK